MEAAITVGKAYEYNHHLDAWAGTVDWRIPFTQHLELSGEFYRGRGIGGLGGGAFKDYVPFADDTIQRGLDAEGGWGQFKIKMTRSIEANFAIGDDNAFAKRSAWFRPGIAAERLS